MCILWTVLWCCGFPTTTEALHLHEDGIDAANPGIEECCNLSVPLTLVVTLIEEKKIKIPCSGAQLSSLVVVTVLSIWFRFDS